MQTVIKVPILTELTPQQVLLMKLLESLGAFNIRGGSITINFDYEGNITGVDKKEHFKVRK